MDSVKWNKDVHPGEFLLGAQIRHRKLYSNLLTERSVSKTVHAQVQKWICNVIRSILVVEFPGGNKNLLAECDSHSRNNSNLLVD
jgi:hypothetical protein